MIEVKLNPCPFCGAEPDYSEYDEEYYSPFLKRDEIIRVHKITCPKCGTYMRAFLRTEVVNRWNGKYRLDPCPICHDYLRQSFRTFRDLEHRFYIECDRCGLRTPSFDTFEEVRDFWNRPVRK